MKLQVKTFASNLDLSDIPGYANFGFSLINDYSPKSADYKPGLKVLDRYMMELGTLITKPSPVGSYKGTEYESVVNSQIPRYKLGKNMYYSIIKLSTYGSFYALPMGPEYRKELFFMTPESLEKFYKIRAIIKSADFESYNLRKAIEAMI